MKISSKATQTIALNVLTAVISQYAKYPMPEATVLNWIHDGGANDNCEFDAIDAWAESFGFRPDFSEDALLDLVLVKSIGVELGHAILDIVNHVSSDEIPE